MQVGGINASESLLQVARQQQISTAVLAKVQNAQRAQGDAVVAAISAVADEAETNSDGDEKGSRFQAIA